MFQTKLTETVTFNHHWLQKFENHRWLKRQHRKCILTRRTQLDFPGGAEQSTNRIGLLLLPWPLFFTCDIPVRPDSVAGRLLSVNTIGRCSKNAPYPGQVIGRHSDRYIGSILRRMWFESLWIISCYMNSLRPRNDPRIILECFHNIIDVPNMTGNRRPRDGQTEKNWHTDK